MRHLAIATIIFASVLASGAFAGRPNVVIIYADDHAQHAIGCYGSKINETPNIDQLAADGVRFTQSFVANSICGPSRACFLTGLHSAANGQTTNRGNFRAHLPTFVKQLQSSGYQTAFVGKWHLSHPPEGFDYWARSKGGYYNPTFVTKSDERKTTGYVTDVITDLAKEWIAGRDVDAPFCIWVSHSAVHRTWVPPLRYLERYNDRDIPEPETLFDDYQRMASGAAKAQMRISRDLFPAYDLKLPVTGSGILDAAAQRQLDAMNSEQRAAWHRAFEQENRNYAEQELTGAAQTRWNYQRYIKNYLRCVDALDDSVGALRSCLSEEELTENTIVVYTSDQGFFLGEHGWYDKRWMYEESMRTPLVISWPQKIKPQTTCDALIQNIDFAPSILDMCEAEPISCHGQSFLPLLLGQPEWRKAIYYHYQMVEPDRRISHLVARHRGIRTDRHKLIQFYDTDEWELYDLQDDPNETQNLYPELAESDLVSSLNESLKALRQNYEPSEITHD